MILADLKSGDVVRVKLSHWQVPMIARVIGRGKEHCQLHGDFIDTTIRFRKHKGLNLRESVMFDLREHGGEPEILEPVDAETCAKVEAMTI